LARRLTTRQATNAGLAIQTVKLVKRLQDHALGDVELSVSQVQAIRILLAKTLPDQKAIEHSGEVAVTWQLRLT
jgi:hypothetical protein